MRTLRFTAPATATRRIGTRLAASAAHPSIDPLPRERTDATIPSVVATSLVLITPDNVAAVAARLRRR